MTVNTLLGLRTDFSLGESAIASEDVAAIAKRMGQKHVAVCDTMTVSGLIDITKSCVKEGIDLHIGVRLRIVDDCEPRGAEGKLINKGAFYIKAWPKNAAGMQRIYKLLSRSTDEDRFFYVSRLTLQDVIDVLADGDMSGRSPDVILSTGCAQGLFTRSDHQEILDRLWGHFVVYNELIAVPTPYYEQINLRSAAGKQGSGNWIITTPCLHDDGDFERLKINMAIQGRGDFRRAFTYADPFIKDFAPKTVPQLSEAIKATIAGMKVSDPTIDAHVWKAALAAGNQEFLDDTAFRWAKEPISLPQLVEDAPKGVLEACKAGIMTRLTKEIFGFKPEPASISTDYIPRLKYELDVLTRLGFCDYFIVAADLVTWAKSVGIMVGPGRGSAGGSLVAYLMGITDIDPIRFGLIFERFINPQRNDLPDADLDFMSSRREEVIHYLEGKYGTDKVAGITNYGVLGSASAMKDVARVFGLDMTSFAPSKFIPSVFGKPVDLEEAKTQSGDISKWADQNPKVWAGALAVQGLMRSYGRHASGVIVSGVPITERAVVERDGTSRKVNWDMRVCEEMGLVKLDILGLSTLDTLSRCVQYVKERHGGLRLDILSIPLDDADTLKAFSLGETCGVFQFEGGAAKRILKDMAQIVDGVPQSPVTFDDLVAANALNRPGPIEAGLVQDYIDGRNGNRTLALPHPNMKPALAETHNVIVYQEQVMRVAVDLCGFTLADADKLRKAMGKKLPEEMKKMRAQFIAGALSTSGMDEVTAGAIFDQIEVFAGYAFNKSHAAEYSLISYQCMWLKIHYPVEFYAAALSTVDEKKLQVIVNDAAKQGIKVFPPDINISTNEFVIGNDTDLYVPFNRIKGVSDKGGDAILHARKDGPFTSIANLTERVERRLCNIRVVGNLNIVGAFARIESQQPATDVSRRKDQMVLLPGLMTGVVTADRDIPKDKFTVAEIVAIRDEVNATDTEAFHSSPRFGKNAKFMVVFDGPGRSEEMERMFTRGETFQYCAAALMIAELDANDAYWTGLVKRRKAGKMFSPTEIRTYQPFLEREVALLKPPLILTLGNAASRYFVPELKGDMMEHCGRGFYNEKLDAMIIIGFNPQQIYHSDEKLDLLAELFDTCKSVILPQI
jgi:DNA polymerase-3 subunit alpha